MTSDPCGRTPAKALPAAFILGPLLIAATLVCATAADQTAAPTATAAAEPPQAVPAEESTHELVLTVGKSVIVNSAATVERIDVASDIAEAMPVSPQELVVKGKAPGETSLIIWQKGGGKLFFDVIVRPNASSARAKLEAARREIKKELGDQNINVNVENDTVFLRGTVKDLTSAARAEAIAATLGKTLNLLYVEVPGAEQQILVKIQFASIDRSVISDLGLNLISTGATNTIGQVTTGQFSPARIDVQPTQTTLTFSDLLNIFMFRRDLNLWATIKALQVRNLFEILAEPNVLAYNGKKASFLAGGEFPYPTLQGGGGGLGAVTIQFREFGVRINFLPRISPRGTIKLEVAPEVSALDYTNGLVFQGFTIPGLTSRKVHTDIELESGQSFAIGGLLDRRLTETMEKIPLLGDVPVLGKLFQSRHRQKNNTELLVIVTPELVRPIPAGQPPPQLEFPAPLMGPDQQHRTPGINVTGPVPVTPTTPALPLEQLIQSIKADTPMQSAGGGGMGEGTWPGVQELPMPTPAAPAPTPPAAPPKQ